MSEASPRVAFAWRGFFFQGVRARGRGSKRRRVNSRALLSAPSIVGLVLSYQLGKVILFLLHEAPQAVQPFWRLANALKEFHGEDEFSRSSGYFSKLILSNICAVSCP